MPFREQGAAVGDDGTYYAFERNSGDHILKQTTTPRDTTSWETVHTFTNASATNFLRDLHITGSGPLLVAAAGVIKRSTDGGSSWTDVYTLSDAGNAVWSFSENSDGDLIAAEYDVNVQLLQSTDDGASWSVLADGTDFSNFSNYVHKARYHPADKTKIIVTGGDGGGPGFYRSTDGGTSWDHFAPQSSQYVGIVGHPTDSTVYFLGGDDSGSKREGVYRVEDSGGTSLDSFRLVQNFNTDGTGTDPAGPFQLYALVTDDGGSGVLGSIVGASRNMDATQMFASTGLDGEQWRAVGETPNGWVTGTTGAGDGENVIDTRRTPWKDSPWIVASDDVLSAKNVLRGNRGGQTIPPLDQAGMRPNPFISTEADFSDIEVVTQVQSPASQTDYTLIDRSDGPKTVLGIWVGGWYAQSQGGSDHRIGPVTVDGTQNSAYPSTDTYDGGDQAGNSHTQFQGFGFHYEDSLTVQWRHPGTGESVRLRAWILDGEV